MITSRRQLPSACASVAISASDIRQLLPRHTYDAHASNGQHCVATAITVELPV
jgi:hypothetical protein